ncbi:MAG: glycoside hydrolase family 30 protein [Chitinophaga sp.]|uniref:glycoside hydrolase family 30 protein n=1 Tax=Chitinophaga sp. TaxID=1869181 RepID=UPI0025C51A6E|nr:glycoside hydrolase family 30 protein [Chitinophaga sp.]MBV8252725.1 glycoside hydrolase family 30 protein [Chitinophaga sp.]
MKRIITSAMLLAFSFNSYSQQQKITVYTTAANTDLRLSQTGTLAFKSMPQPLETEPCVFVDPKVSFQTFTGIGGALTDASAETFAKLPKAKQEEFLQAYYSISNGIGYTFARTNIQSCDFSSDTYTYIEEHDSTLKTFNIKHDLQYKIPFIKAATQAAGGKLPLFISPWSPPAWMKDNNDMLHGGHLLRKYYQAWANHYIKFIRAYESLGVPVWGLSVQNEPMAKQKWESCIFTAEEERDFIKGYLGPTLAKAGMSTKKLLAWDHNRDLLYQRASTLLQDKETAKYIWGIGYHWYETWTGSDMQFQNERLVQQAFPHINLVFTEGCVEKFDFNRLHDWAIGERYGYSLVNDFNSGTVAWTDWNVLLDENGGPNHVGNFCFAPVHADTRSGELIYTNAYYYLGHFSKFIRPGAKRIVSSSSRSPLQTTAFRNADGKLAVVVLNMSDQEIPYHLWIAGKAAATTSQPHSISTLIIE